MHRYLGNRQIMHLSRTTQNNVNMTNLWHLKNCSEGTGLSADANQGDQMSLWKIVQNVAHSFFRQN
jgi:hypothetical protein